MYLNRYITYIIYILFSSLGIGILPIPKHWELCVRSMKFSVLDYILCNCLCVVDYFK